MSRLPIRVRLTLAFALVMALVFAAVGVVLYARLGDTLDESIADTLEARTSALATTFDVASSVVAGEETLAQVLDGDGTVVAGSGGASERSLLTPEQLERARAGAIAVEKEIEDAEFRVLATSVGDRIVVVGASLDDRDEALDGLLTQLLVVLPVALVVSSLIGYLVAGAALRPVEEMRRRASEISADTPERRLPLPRARDEVYRLGETLNEMLVRLDAGLARERRFVADASHELRTPLAALRTELELATRRPRSPEELASALRSAEEEVERLARLAEALLTLAGADEGLLPLEVERHEAREVLEAVTERSRSRASASGRALELAVAGDSNLSCDRIRLEQALENLVDNAFRHGSGTIRLSARGEDGEVAFSVSDDGPGFPPEFLPRAFERFSRADAARSGGGAGLGLAIVDAIARSHGGSVHAASRDGGGAEVTIVIPAVLAHRDLI